jgi:multidrug efflux pump subunit AcrA (membrane-fusion protein)
LKGQKVDLVLTKFPDKKFSGKVTNIATEKAGFLTSEVIVTIDEAPKELPSGMISIADIVLSNGERVSNIEIKAESEREYFVKVIKDTGVKSEKSQDDGKIAKIRNFFSWKSNAKTDEPQEEEKVIKVGERTQSSIEILEGLKEGDKVMIIPIGGEEKNKKKENQG